MAFPNLNGALVVVLAVVVVVGGGRGVVGGRGLEMQPELWLTDKRSRRSRAPSMVRLGSVWFGSNLKVWGEEDLAWQPLTRDCSDHQKTHFHQRELQPS